MVRYETYRANAAEAPILRRWVLLGLVLSLALHGGLFWYFSQQRVEGFSLASERLAPPRAFNMKRVALPEMPPEEQRLKVQDRPVKVPSVEVPQEKPELQEVHVAPQITELSRQFIINEKPRVDAAPMNNLAKPDATSRNNLDRELSNIAQNLIKDAPRNRHQPIIPLATGRAGSGPGAGEANVAIPGLASVDDMLAHTGALRTGEKAAMPGGALFEYDKYELLPDAVDALRRLAMLIRQNPKATFSIEGHTDSFGPPDYNQKLSEKRAEAVKAWLVTSMGIAPERVQTRGYGNQKPIVPAERSVEEQAPNRRVEIVVKTNRH